MSRFATKSYPRQARPGEGPATSTRATLEWSESLVLQGRHQEATEVLEDAYPLIGHWGAPVDILRAWKIVEEAIRQRIIHHQAFRGLALTIRRRWHQRP